MTMIKATGNKILNHLGDLNSIADDTVRKVWIIKEALK